MDCLKSIPFLPHPLLQAYVSSYLFTSVATDLPMEMDIFPVGHSVLSFALQEIPAVFEWGRSINTRFNITGQLTKNYKVPLNGNYSYVYVLFKPYGAYRLLGVPQHYLKEQCLDILDVGGLPTKKLYEQLVDQGSNYYAVVHLLEAWLLKQLERRSTDQRLQLVMHACEEMVLTEGAARISDLYKKLGTSKSSHERQFHEMVGLSPKGFHNVARFLQALNTMRQ
jgi:hypothetical protein